jgi:hypothetical protein
VPDRVEDNHDVLHVLLDEADDREDEVIREVAVRARLLWLCRCGWYNAAVFERCENCRTRRLDSGQPRTTAAVKLSSVRDYLTRAYGDPDGDARFVDACRTGLCEMPAWAAAEDVLDAAEHYGYGRAWPILAEEIIAAVDTSASTAMSR